MFGDKASMSRVLLIAFSLLLNGNVGILLAAGHAAAAISALKYGTEVADSRVSLQKRVLVTESDLNDPVGPLEESAPEEELPFEYEVAYGDYQDYDDSQDDDDDDDDVDDEEDTETCDLQQDDIDMYGCLQLYLLWLVPMTHLNQLSGMQLPICAKQQRLHSRRALHPLPTSLLLHWWSKKVAAVHSISGLDVGALLCSVRGG